MNNVDRDLLWSLVSGKVLQRREEVEYMCDLIEQYDISSVLEIGTYKGGTAAVYAAYGCSVVTIDSYDNADKAWESTEYKAAFPNAQIKFICGDSRDKSVVAQAPESYDLLFIDGGHDWATGVADLMNYGKKAAVVAIHDLEQLGDEPFGDWFPIRFWKKLQDKAVTVVMDTHFSGDKGNWGVMFMGDPAWIDGVKDW